MEVLWAPWRMEYILSDNKEAGCIFCPGNNRNKDEERLVLHADETVMVVMNKYPYANGHILIAPAKHVSGLEHLSLHESHDLTDMVRYSIEILKEEVHPEGFNVGLNLGKTAGAGVAEHLHFHIVPRWNGDTNFMTVTADVKVIPEHIRNTYVKLLPYFKKPFKTDGGKT